MCSNRNHRIDACIGFYILDHWEMCSNRNNGGQRSIATAILDHWEMCSNRNQLIDPCIGF